MSLNIMHEFVSQFNGDFQKLNHKEKKEKKEKKWNQTSSNKPIIVKGKLAVCVIRWSFLGQIEGVMFSFTIPLVWYTTRSILS